METGSQSAPEHSQQVRIPDAVRPLLAPVVSRVFWWGNPEEWLEDTIRFVAQVMTFGDWDDTALVVRVLGENVFRDALANPPSGVFDIKSWNYWHHRYHLKIPPLPSRKFKDV